MKLKLFVDRPIFASCISVLLVILGLICIKILAVEQYPNIAPPTVSVNATYNGASAETVMRSVIVPLEEEINGVEGMSYMTSSATNSGTATITVYFKQGTDPDMAAVNVQNRVSKAQSSLPAEVTKYGVSTEKSQNGNLKVISIYSKNKDYDSLFLSNYLKINIVPQIMRITGVGKVTVLGNDYAMRLWLNPAKLNQFNLVPSDITSVLATQNIEAATGTLGSNSDNTFLYTLKYRGRYESIEDFENMVIKSLSNGNILRLKDVAKIELGSFSYSYTNNVNGYPAATMMITQTAGSNASEIIEQIDELENQVREQLPKGIYLDDLLNVNDFLSASIHEVIKTLVEALVLVTIVVYFFLQSLRSVIIPTISILVSLIATFAFIYVAGFSINLLTLFAMVLVIGTVVDDAIVVVEAVQARFEEGEKSSYKATMSAIDTISTAIMTTSLVFMSVFIPVAFTGGTSGIFYTQFGVTMAVAVGISAINALTLCPALCALLMRPANYELPENQKGFTYRYHVMFEAGFSAVINKYKKFLLILFKKKYLTGALLIISVALMVFLMKTTKTGLVPDEDQGVMFVAVTASPGYTLNQTNKVMSQVEEKLKDIPQIYLYTSIAGYNMLSGSQSSSSGTIIIKLKNWEERPNPEDSINAITQKIMESTQDIKSASIFAFAPPMVSGYGNTNGLSLSVQNRQGDDINKLYQVTSSFIAKLNERPEISYAMTSFDPRYPQYKVTVDAAKCLRMNVSPTDVLSVVSGYIGSSYSSNINLYSKLYKVMVQASPEFTKDLSSFSNMFVKSSNGDMLPVRQFLILDKVYGPEELKRFNLFNSIAVNAAPAPGYSSGEAIAAVEATAKEVLPMGFGYEYDGMTREEASTGSSTIVVYTMCLIFVFLILSSLYESVLIPFAVLLSVPSAITGAFIFANLMGIENNIYMQTGIIMLMGLIAKTAILLTEFASEKRREGMSIAQASLTAAKERFRPILMTSICMIVGLMPLVLAHGVGANGNRSLGVGVVGGMLVGIICLLITTPVFFIVIQYIQEKLVAKFKLGSYRNQ